MNKTRLILLTAITIASANSSWANLLVNPGAEDGDLTGWTVGGSSNPGVDSGTFDPGINPHTGKFDFYGHTGASGSLSQNVNLVTAGFSIAQINSGDLLANISFWEQGLNQGTPSDDAFVTVTFLDASSAVISSKSTSEIDSHNGAWQNETDTYAVPTGTVTIDYEMDFVRHAGSDLDAFVDDNSLTITSPATTSAVPEPTTILTGAMLLLPFGASLLRKLRGNRAA